MRTSKTLKTAGAVHEVALQVLKDVPIGSKEIVVFLSPKSVVSDNWVASLFHTLSQHPKSGKHEATIIKFSELTVPYIFRSYAIITVVYPGVDVLDTYKKRVVRGHNVLGGFDWGFSFKWEVKIVLELFFIIILVELLYLYHSKHVNGAIYVSSSQNNMFY